MTNIMENTKGVLTSVPKTKKHKAKPIELFFFVDPINPECWSLAPTMKKLELEYGDYFSTKYILWGNLKSFNILPKHHDELAKNWRLVSNRSGMSCDDSLWIENPLTSSFNASIGIKAAEMQGKKVGEMFLRKVQEAVFIYKMDVTKPENLIKIARELNIDLEEFISDLNLEGATIALQNDVRLSNEMTVDDTPTIIFYGDKFDDEGLRIFGAFSFEVYEQILIEKLGFQPKKAELPSIEEFLEKYGVVASQEIATVYKKSLDEVNKKMTEFLFDKKVERISAKYGDFWRLNNSISLGA